MLKLTLLLAPVIIPLFWAIALFCSRNGSNIPRCFLGRIMIILFGVYLSHLFYFYPLPGIYHHMDIVYQMLNLILFPVYYIYIRLLTKDSKVTFKRHARYFIFPLLFTLQYAIGAVLMTKDEHIEYLYTSLFSDDHLTGLFLYQKFIYFACRGIFIIQGIFYLYRSYSLIIKHKDRIKEYYAGNEEQQLNSLIMLTTSLFVTTISAIVMSAIGKEKFMDNADMLIFPSLLFSSLIFFIGWIGHKQYAIPLPQNQGTINAINSSSIDIGQFELIQQRLTRLFENEKIYRDKNLTIWEVARLLNCNVQHISRVINIYHSENFHEFVEKYRVAHAINLIAHNHTNETSIALASGFNSVRQMKKALGSRERDSKFIDQCRFPNSTYHKSGFPAQKSFRQQCHYPGTGKYSGYNNQLLQQQG